ncbi:MAG: cysteine synthase A [Candidatus Wallbacteria bacterium]|nr:cysteine synthase A [Candidatus Wallbacteria bacterium]
MKRIFQSVALSIGNTPLVLLNNISKCFLGRIAVKIEGRNPANSVKCRIGASMIWDAENRGILHPGSSAVTVIEPTSGNTGIALAFVCASKGYPLVLTMPETMSMERRKMLHSFGAKLILTDGNKGMRGAIEKAEEIVAGEPESFFMPQQFRNPANPLIHFNTTGPEIWNDTAGEIDIFIAGVGTGGTITGVSRFIKQEKGKQILSVAVEPAASPVLTAIRNGTPPQPGPHKIQGIGAGFVPEVLDLSLVDDIATVTDAEAYDFTRRMLREEGISCGLSSGAAVAVASRYARMPENKGKLIVSILADIWDRYLSIEEQSS